MKVLITGGAGFIGSAIARAYLDRGATVTVIDSLVTGRQAVVPEEARFHLLDVRDPLLERIFAAQGPFDVVSHHAALKDVRQALLDPRADAEANILGTLNVLRCAAEYQTGRFVFPSSAAIYGDPPELPTPETAPMAPISPYGISKAAGEAYCRFFAVQRGLPVVALRYGTVYGPTASEESEAGAITIFTRRMLADLRPAIYGDGEQTRDFVSVDDVVAANLLVAEHAPTPWTVYNVSPGQEVSINAVCRLLAELIGFDAAPEYHPPKGGEVHRNVLDCTRIRQELGWQATVSLREGLARVVKRYREEAQPVR